MILFIWIKFPVELIPKSYWKFVIYKMFKSVELKLYRSAWNYIDRCYVYLRKISLWLDWLIEWMSRS